MIEAAALYQEIDALNAAVRREGDAQAAAWAGHIAQEGFEESAANLAHYLALRHRDLRPLQRPLMVLGLSSLGPTVSLSGVKDPDPEIGANLRWKVF